MNLRVAKELKRKSPQLSLDKFVLTANGESMRANWTLREDFHVVRLIFKALVIYWDESLVKGGKGD